MKKTDTIKLLAALIITISIAFLSFHGRISSISSADETKEAVFPNEVYFAEETETETTATDTDAKSDAASIAEVSYNNSIVCGSIVYYQGQPYTRYYTVYRNGTAYRAYCGDHSKNAVRNTDNVTFSTSSNELIRKAFCYGPESPYAWSGFKNMGDNDKQLVMALTLNYIRHGQYFPVISGFYDYISSDKTQDVWLTSETAALSLTVEGDKDSRSLSVKLENYKRYTVPDDGSVRKRTKLLRLNGDKNNYVTLDIPKGSWIHVKRMGTDKYIIKKSGSVKINGGDYFFFTADLKYRGEDNVKSSEGQCGITVCTADSNSTALDQQLLFADDVTCCHVEISVKWTEVTDYGYMWMTKNRTVGAGGQDNGYSTKYNGERYGFENYSLAGISYLVTDTNGRHVYRYILSYDGNCYVDKDTGAKMVLKTPKEKSYYGSALGYQYAKLPLGTYRVEESDCLWSCNNSTGELIKTKTSVKKSGYYRKKGVRTVKITKDNDTPSKARALYISEENTPLTGEFGLKKTDSSNKKPVSGAVYYVVRKASGSLKTDKRVASLTTDKNGVGIVTESLFGGKGKTMVTELPVGEYIIYEHKAPKMYKKNNDVVKLIISSEGESLYAGNRLIGKTSTYSIKWNTEDEPIEGNVSLRIYKQDVGTGTAPQGEGTLSGALFTVNYYSGQYENVENLPKKPDRSWNLKTDDSGCCMLSLEYLSDDIYSDELFFDDKGNVTIPEGTVTVEETAPPKGYTLQNSVMRNGDDGCCIAENYEGIYINHIVNDGDSMYLDMGNELIVQNHVVRGDFCFTKKDSDTGRNIAGVAFLLEDHDRTHSVVIHTDENGFYSSSSDYIPHSKDTNGGEPSNGIWFGQEEVDDTKGALPYGTYYLSEMRCDANRGIYKKIDTIEFNVDSDGCIVKLGDILNERLPVIETSARDEESNTQYANASKETIKLVDTVTMSGLESGHSYRLHGEVMDKSTGKILDRKGTSSDVNFEADGENMSVDVHFEFSSQELAGKDLVCFQELADEAYDDEIIAAHKDINAEGQTVHVGQKTLSVSKKAVSGTDELPGAELAIFGEKGELVEKWISGKNPHIIKDIQPGHYMLKELSAPAGYLISKPVTFDITDDYIPQTVEMIDEIARISIIKTDDINGNPLSGVEFTLYLADNDKKISSGVTDADGKLEFEHISPGKYYIMETKTLEGYIPCDRIDVTVKENQYENIPVIRVKNHYGIVNILKEDSKDGSRLRDAVFELYDSSDRLIGETATGEDGCAQFKDIPAGKYYIIEKNAPKGYVKSKKKVAIDTEKKQVRC